MMGVLLLVGGIVVAISATGTPGHIASRSRQLVCQIGGEGCAPAAPPRTSLPRRGGPPLGHGTKFRVLPFPGSITVTCTADKKSAKTTCLPKGKTGVTVQVAGEIKVERSPTTLDANGCPWQKLSITTKLQLVGQGEYKGAKAGGTLQAYLGTQTKYELTVTPHDADAIAGGDREAPNPVDPRSLATGESIQLNEDFYAGLGLKDFVRAALKAGVKVGSLVQLGLGSSKDLANGKLTLGRHRHLGRRRLGRLPAVRGHRAPAGRGPRRLAAVERDHAQVHGHAGAPGQARRRPAGRAARLVRGPCDGDDEPGRQQGACGLRPLQRHRKYNGVEYDFGGLESLLGEAESPNEELIALYHGGASAASALNNLLELVLRHGGHLPGTIATPSC